MVSSAGRLLLLTTVLVGIVPARALSLSRQCKLFALQSDPLLSPNRPAPGYGQEKYSSLKLSGRLGSMASVFKPDRRHRHSKGMVPSMALPPILQSIREILRGGGPFHREGNEAKYRSWLARPRVGIDISSNLAIMLSALSVLLVSGSLPMLWRAPQGLWESFWLTRIVLLRSLSLVYFVAFAVAFNQNGGLLGNNGLLPASVYLDRVRKQHPDFPERGMTLRMFNEYPTWLWLAPKGRMDDCLRTTALIGMVLSASVLINGGSNMPIQVLLWLLYHSIVTVGQRWYSFGWESQLLESGFISVFMVPLLSVSSLPAAWATPWCALWAWRWLCFRIMIGAGMIKIRGDSCWRDLTAMCYHYETQPVPNPVSWFLHWTPVWFHKFETAANHVIELILPWLVICPLRPLILFGGLVQLLFQAILVISGNLSFLNWLTMIPALAAFDDAALSFLFSPETLAKVHTLNAAAEAASGDTWGAATLMREGAYAVFCAFVVWLSGPVIRNILSTNQVMNTSFGSWRFVNSYGAFGSVTRTREEVIVQGTHADLSDPVLRWKADEQEWREYEFKVKPGDVNRRPPWISPYHYRLDWLMWFLPFSDSRRNPWVYHLFGKLLVNDKEVGELIRINPFAGDRPPKYVRAELYRYEYSQPGSEAAKKGQWWTRSRVRQYVEPYSLTDLEHIYRQFDWPMDVLPGQSSEAESCGSSTSSTSSAGHDSANDDPGAAGGKGSRALV